MMRSYFLLVTFISVTSVKSQASLESSINFYCSQEGLHDSTIEAAEECFSQSMGVNSIVARKCEIGKLKTLKEQRQDRCSKNPLATFEQSSLVSQCYIEEAIKSGDMQTVNEVRRVKSILDSFNFLGIHNFLKTQAADLDLCLKKVLNRTPLDNSVTPKMRERRQAYPPVAPVVPVVPVAPVAQAVPAGPAPGGYGYDPYGQAYPGYGYNQYDNYRPYGVGRNERDFLWRNRERQINRDLRALGYGSSY